MKATFLSAAVPLTKTFTIEDGELKKTGHPRVIEVSSWQHDFETIEDLYNMLLVHAEEGHCFLKGNVTRVLRDETRAGSTDPNEVTRVLLLDLDGIKDIASVEQLLAQLGLSDVDHIIQFSASMGVLPMRGLSAHVFLLLDRPWYPAMLKQWLTHVNLTNQILRANVGLTRTNNALRWALDVGTCQNDKLIYIAPPIVGEGVKDELVGNRIQLHVRAKRCATLPDKVPTAEANRVASEALLNELREKAGLPKRKRVSYKSAGSVDYMSNPDHASVTGIKEERGFVYLNLNGGDSWGYYHPANNPTYILNFKGEPNYKTSELLPEYWQEVKSVLAAPRVDDNGIMYLAFRDFRTAGYWNGTWDPKRQDLRIAMARGKEQLEDFLAQHWQPALGFIPDWDVSFNPQSEVIVDAEAKKVNLFQPSRFMRLPHVRKEAPPPLVTRVIKHALGNDDEAFERFMNWIAVILQHRCRTMTAWVLHGTQGTGKGIMLNYILRPIFGMDYVVSKRMEELESQFNGFMERCLILFLDEAQMSSFGRKDVMDANLKNYIVEPRISIRKMHTMPFEADNYLNLVFASNKHDPVMIDPEDRRFNVAVYQPERLAISDDEVDGLAGELEHFYHYLMTRPADRALARTPLNNTAKQKMVHVSMSALDVVCRALVTGDFSFLWDQRPTHGKTHTGDTTRDMLAGKYSILLREIALGKRDVLSRDEVQDILAFTVGGIPPQAIKFSSLVKHHGINFEPTSRDGRSMRGLKVGQWKIPENLKREIEKG